VQQTSNQQAMCTAIAGKAGDILTFKAEDLPQKPKIDRFNLGQINARQDILNIAAPTSTGSVLLSFVTNAGLPVNFLIKRQPFSKADLDKLDTASPEAAAYKAQLAAKLPANSSAILTTYYRQLAGIESTWTELSSDLNAANNDPFSPTFNARVYPNGLVVLDINVGRSSDYKKRFFYAGDIEIQLLSRIITNPRQMPIGNGKFVSPNDV
jgi:hypothetical protein